MPRTQIRKVVSEYNKVKDIGDEDAILNKVITDLDQLNIHRTPQNCLTLLKVSENHFDERPVNRTKLLEMVLFVLFNLDGIPTYKTRPDLKDCEYILGAFCEDMIRKNIYHFSRNFFLTELQNICKTKFIDLEVDVVFDVLMYNNIITERNEEYVFRSSFWIFYFGAKRMQIDKSFCDYIFESKKYIAFPEIIEFYTGIDRNRKDALEILTRDISQTCDVVFNKVGIPDNINPFVHAKWMPTEAGLQKMHNEIGESVLKSKLPDEVKDQYADRDYDQIRPYDQSVRDILEEYSLLSLMSKIKATSRALRNSDYVDPIVKKKALDEILRGWEQVSKVLFALTPILAIRGEAVFEGADFTLRGDFGTSQEEREKRILFVIPINVVGYFKDDLYSAKLGPLLFDKLANETNHVKRHQIALTIILERPRGWKSSIEGYIVSLNKDSFFLYETVNTLRAKYRFDFVDESTLKEISYLIKMGLAKHQFGEKNPGLDKILKISNSALPHRDESQAN